MATEGNAENDKTPLLIAEFHPSESFPNFQAMFSELKHGSSLIRKEFIKGVYDVYHGTDHIARYYDLKENKNLNYIYLTFQSESERKYVMSLEVRLRFLEQILFPKAFKDNTSDEHAGKT
jgi:hypothetical protein